MSMKTLLLTAGITLASASASMAAVVYASSVDEVNRGTITTSAAVDATRDDPMNALGAPDAVVVGGILNGTYSLGIGGDITLGFGQTFNNESEVTVFEVTFGSTIDFPESVTVEAVLGGAVVALVGSITNTAAQAGATLSFAGTFDALKFTDTSAILDGRPLYDGFDLDSVSVSPVPLPATGLLLLGGLGGIAAMRRRKKA